MPMKAQYPSEILSTRKNAKYEPIDNTVITIAIFKSSNIIFRSTATQISILFQRVLLLDQRRIGIV